MVCNLVYSVLPVHVNDFLELMPASLMDPKYMYSGIMLRVWIRESV